MSQEAKSSGSGLGANAGILGIAGIFVYKVACRTALRLSALWHVHPWILGLLGVALAVGLVLTCFGPVWNLLAEKEEEKSVTAADETSVYLGKSAEGEPIHIKQASRTTHTQVIGTTSAGKTESVILPWAIRDLETGAGLLIIDGKSDKTFLEKFYAYAVRSGRKSDFRLFSLALPDPSSTFNPLFGGTSYEIAERVFSAFTFEDEYYRNVQYKLFHAAIRLILNSGKVPTFALVRRLLTDSIQLKLWLERCDEEDTKYDLAEYLKLPDQERAKRISGLDAHLSHFSTGELAQLFNANEPQIVMDDVLRENLICYFQLPSMYYQQLSSATGRLVLQSFQNAVAKRHLGLAAKPGFFSCYLDDFQDYIYEGFGALLNKSRSANVGVVFSHQALGDLEKVSPAFKNVVLTNTNVKCIMRSNDPDTCEYFAKSLGTKEAEKVTERRQTSIIGERRTGEGSVRAVEEFRFHPNEIRSLGTGEGIVSIPHFTGVRTVKLRFKRREDIQPVHLPRVLKERLSDLNPNLDKNVSTCRAENRVNPNDLNVTEVKTNDAA